MGGCRTATQRTAFSVHTLSLFNMFDYCNTIKTRAP